MLTQAEAFAACRVLEAKGWRGPRLRRHGDDRYEVVVRDPATGADVVYGTLAEAAAASAPPAREP